jgi:hypothetical protein
LSDLWELYPHLDGAYITLFEDAFKAHQAAGTILRIANAPASSLPELSPGQLAQRTAILKIPFKILVNERNKALDDFCRAWVKLRSANEPSPQQLPMGRGGPQEA